MTALRNRIEAQLKERIRSTATDCDDGKPSNVDFGPLLDRLDEIIGIVEQIRDYSVEPYQQQVYEAICSTCRADETGFCSARDDDSCALDKHLPLIVAIIEKELKAEYGS